MALSLPPPTQPLTNEDYITEPWYRVFGEITRLRADLEALQRLTEGMGAMDASGSGTAAFVGST